MSLNKVIEIACPKCNKKQNFTIWQSINVTENIELKPLVFNQDIFRFKCEECNSEIFVEYPFIYHDNNKKFFVYFNSSGDFKNVIENEGYKTRTTSSYLEFLETIKILEDEVDEIEILKAKEELLKKFKANEKLKGIEKLYYTNVENNKIVFFVPEINGKISI